MLLRLLFFLLYIVGFGLPLLYLFKYRPQSEGFVDPTSRLLRALLRMWGVWVWPLPGLLWLGVLPLPAPLIIIFSIFIPPLFYLAFLIWTKVFKFVTVLPFVALVLLFDVVALPFLLVYAAPLLQELLFLLFVSFPPLLSVLLFTWWAAELVPMEPDEPDRVRKACSLLVGLFTTYPKTTWMVKDGNVQSVIRGNPFLGAGPGWVITEPENVVAIKAGSNISRIVGPGVIFTGATEMVHSVLDLRQQIRITRVDAITKDGVGVRVPLSSIFCINPGEDGQVRLNEPWPYRKSDAYKVFFAAAEVNPEGKTPLDASETRPWEDLPLRIAVPRLKQAVMEYTLDELYDAGMDNPIPRSTLGGQVRSIVKDELEPKGFKIQGGGVGNKVVPLNDKVVAQRIEAWKARWVREIMAKKGAVQAERFRKLTLVRSQALAKLLESMIKQMQVLHDEDDRFVANLRAYWLLESLQHMASTPEIQPLLPDSAALVLEDLRKQAR